MEKSNDNLRIKTRCRRVEFDIHRAIMDAGLGNYADIVLKLLKEGYGYESRDENNKYDVVKDKTSLNVDEQRKELGEALVIIFGLLKCFRQKISEELFRD